MQTRANTKRSVSTPRMPVGTARTPQTPRALSRRGSVSSYTSLGRSASPFSSVPRSPRAYSMEKRSQSIERRLPRSFSTEKRSQSTERRPPSPSRRQFAGMRPTANTANSLFTTPHAVPKIGGQMKPARTPCNLPRPMSPQPFPMKIGRRKETTEPSMRSRPWVTHSMASLDKKDHAQNLALAREVQSTPRAISIERNSDMQTSRMVAAGGTPGKSIQVDIMKPKQSPLDTIHTMRNTLPQEHIEDRAACFGTTALTFTLSSTLGVLAGKLIQEDPSIALDKHAAHLIPVLLSAKAQLLDTAEHLDSIITNSGVSA